MATERTLWDMECLLPCVVVWVAVACLLLPCTHSALPALPSAFDKKKAGMAIGNTAKLSDEMDMWSHVKSLYQNPTATCLYGKNNILMKLVSLMRFNQQPNVLCCMSPLPMLH